MTRFERAGACVILIVVAAAAAAGATQVIHRTPRQLAERASIAALGTVSEVRSYWNGQRTKIFTAITIDVAETYKGEQLPSITVIQPGGVVGIVRVTVSGALAWMPGEEVLVLAEPLKGGSYRISGFSQGKFQVERDPDTGKAFVRGPAPVDDGRVAMSPGGEHRIPARSRRMPLEQFVEQVLHIE